MVNIFSKDTFSFEKDRQQLFNGDLIMTPSNAATRELCEFAKAEIENAFSPLDPLKAQDHLSTEAFVEIISTLKSHFTNHSHTKQLIQNYIQSICENADELYFDVPRLRVVTYNNYLSSGVGYAYLPHRDTWYSSPEAQINVWLPIYEITAESTMAFFTEYWDTPIKNSSADFNYDEWCLIGRKQAKSQLKEDTRNHPVPLEKMSTGSEVRLVPSPAAPIYFSAAHLHQTISNTSPHIRYSLDFRLISKKDLQSNLGAPNIDNHSQGTTLFDFFHAQSLEPFTR